MGTIAKLSIVKGQQQELIPRHLHRIFEENVVHHSNKTALIHYNDAPSSAEIQQTLPRQTSYFHMNQRANQCARLLVREATQRYLQPNSDGDFIIAVCMQPSDDLVTTLMAIWKSGSAYLPIDPTFPANRIHHILKESSPVIVVHDDNIDKTRFGSKVITLSITELNTHSMQLEEGNLMAAEMLGSGVNNLAIVFYTSGTTGIPKGVRLPHAVILNRLQWQWRTFPYSLTEKVCVFKTALAFGDSVAELWSPLLCGLAILVIPKVITKDPERLVEMMEKYKIRRLVLVPTLLRSLLMYLNLDGNRLAPENESKRLYNLQTWVCSGEPLPVTLATNFYDYFQEGTHALYNFYGSTEVMADVTYFKCESKKQLQHFDRVPIGVPVTNTVVYLLDAEYRPVKKGEVGEIYVSGLNLADGYVNGRDKDRFLENPFTVELKYSRLYRTGDYGSVSDGFIIYEGRTDSQIKIRGHRVDLSEVEKNVSELPPVEKAIVLCYRAGQVNQALLAFVKLRDDSALFNEMQLEDELRDKLADYMIPQVVLIDQVPLMVNGKVDRQALLKQYDTANTNEDDSSILLDFDYSQVPAEFRAVAEDLFETVGGVIGRSIRATLAPHSNFYELGGNSLNSIYTVTLLREKGYSIGISEFITAKNLGEILQSMTKDREINVVEDAEDWLRAFPHLDMEAIPLQYSHKEDVIQIIGDSFYSKFKMNQWLKPDILHSDYRDFISDIWNHMVEKDLSFVVHERNTNRIIGTTLNYDARDEPEMKVNSKLGIIFEFVEFVEGPIRDNYLPKGLNKILQSCMMGTHVKLNPQENIACMHFMEHELLRVAKEKQFAGILTTNANPLTQQLANDVHNYEKLLDYQINEYVFTDGTQPFRKAPDSERATVHWKEVSPS